jgi:hypothetical protein
MLDESTSRTVEKSLIIYVRYFEGGEARTTFYGILGLDGDGTASSDKIHHKQNSRILFSFTITT